MDRQTISTTQVLTQGMNSVFKHSTHHFFQSNGADCFLNKWCLCACSVTSGSLSHDALILGSSPSSSLLLTVWFCWFISLSFSFLICEVEMNKTYLGGSTCKVNLRSYPKHLVCVQQILVTMFLGVLVGLFHQIWIILVVSGWMEAGVERDSSLSMGFLFGVMQISWATLVAQTVKNPSAVQETWVRSLGQEYPLEKGMATHSSVLA